MSAGDHLASRASKALAWVNKGRRFSSEADCGVLGAVLDERRISPEMWIVERRLDTKGDVVEDEWREPAASSPHSAEASSLSGDLARRGERAGCHDVCVGDDADTETQRA